MPFTVYEDTAEKETVAPPALDKENQENCPPGGYKNPPKRKSTAGILVLSNDVPFVPLEEQEKEEEEEIEGGFLEVILQLSHIQYFSYHTYNISVITHIIEQKTNEKKAVMIK